ncbi:MAG TPA: hypothetical protein VM616_05105 [Gammaproteobacteria bacterium]|nr:hypothetical protein [Gammaproteobacteria bacterium]
MNPLAFITGILLGSAGSIALGLVVVCFIFLVLGTEHPRLAAELGPLLASAALFVVMTVVCGVSFIGLIRRRRWRWLAQGVMWTGVLLVVAYYVA